MRPDPNQQAVAAPLVLSVFSTFGVGGPQVRFAAFANHFGRGYRHHLVSMDGDYSCAERLRPDIEVEFPRLRMQKGAMVRNARSFRSALKDLRPDVLLTHNWGTIEWAVANAVPVVRHVHVEDGFGPEEAHVQLQRRVLMRRAFLRSVPVVVPSRRLFAIATDLWRLAAKHVHYIPNGVDLARFARTGKPQPRVPWPRDLPVVGTVAALRTEKNIGRLIRAFGRLRTPARLVIVGDGPARSELEAEVASLGLAGRVRFIGHVTDSAPLYSGFDVFALSSDTEQMPLSILEAMAAGLPVASVEVGDVRTMVAAENERFMVARDDVALASAIDAVLDAPDLCRHVGLANRRKAEAEFDQARMFQSYAAVLNGSGRVRREVLTQPRRHGPRRACG